MSVIVNGLENPGSLGADTLARKWVLDVNIAYGLSEIPEWVRMRGIQEQSPSEEATTQDSSDYDSQGWKSSASTAMTWGWEVTVARKTALDGVTYDEAQEYLRAKSLRMGPGNVAEVRGYEWSGVDGPRVQAYRGLVGVSYAEQGGAMDALSTARFKLSGQGRRYDIPHPAGPTEWTVATPYSVGDQVDASDGSVLQATVAGTSNATGTGPTAVTAAAGTLDGTVKWKVIEAP